MNPQQSWDSVIRAAARAMYYPRPTWAADLAGRNASAYAVVPSEDVVRALAPWIKQPFEVLWGTTLHGFAPRLNLDDPGSPALDGKALMRFAHHRRLGARLCRLCEALGRPPHVGTLLRPVTTCPWPDHEGVVLTESCSANIHPIGPRELWEGACACGRPLGDAAASRLGEDTVGLAAQRLILANLVGEADTGGLSVPVWFASLDFLQKWLSGFPRGTLEVDGITTAVEDPRNHKLWAPLQVDHVHYTLAVGVLQGGRDAFFDLCRLWLAHRPPHRHFASGFFRDFARVAQILEEYPRPAFDHLHGWLAAFLAEEWSGGLPRQARRAAVNRPRLVGLAHACRILGCSTWNVVRLVRSGRLRGRVHPMTRTGRVRASVDAASAHELAERRAAAVPLAEAARTIGIAEEALQALCQARLLPAERGPLADGATRSEVHPSAVAGVIERLRTLTADHSSEMVPLDEMTPAEAGVALVQALRGERAVHAVVTSGRITAAWIGPQTQMTSEDTNEPAEPDDATVADAIEFLGVSNPVLDLLIQAGLIGVRGGMLVGVRTFAATHAWSLEAMEVLGVGLPTFRRWVASGRLVPVLRLETAFLFRRADLVCYAHERRCGTTEAAAILGCAPQDVLRRYVSTGLLRPIGGPRVDGGKDVILDRHEVLGIATEELPPVVPVARAAAFLGVSIETVRGWLRKGIVQPSLQKPPIRRGYTLDRATVLSTQPGRRYFEPSSATITRPRTVVPPPPPAAVRGALVTAREAAEILGCTLKNFPHRYRRTGRLSPCYREPWCRRDYYWRADVEALRSAPRPEAPTDGYLTAEEAASAMNVSLRHFYRYFVQAGRLPPSSAHSANYGARFERRAVEAWATYLHETLKPREVECRLLISGPTLRRWRKLGILRPVWGPDGFAAAGYCRYLMSDVERLHAERGSANRCAQEARAAARQHMT